MKIQIIEVIGPEKILDSTRNVLPLHLKQTLPPIFLMNLKVMGYLLLFFTTKMVAKLLAEMIVLEF